MKPCAERAVEARHYDIAIILLFVVASLAIVHVTQAQSNVGSASLSNTAIMERDRDISKRLAPADRDRALKLFDQSFALYQAGKFDAAKVGFERGLEIDPANGPANYYLGDILVRAGDQEGARARYLRAKFFAPDSSEGLEAEVALGKLPPLPPPEPPIKPMVAGLQDCTQCPRMMRIPGGSMLMGGDPTWPPTGNPSPALPDISLPQHRVAVPGFLLGIYSVTFDEWDACVTDGGCSGYRPSDNGWGRGQRPVINVSWDDAQNYAEWLSRKTGKHYRLPSEAEWEYAANGNVSKESANCCGTFYSRKNVFGETAPVGQFQQTAFGLYDMLGNVQQWMQDCRNVGYVGAPADGTAWNVAAPQLNRLWKSGSCEDRVVRGSAWLRNLLSIQARYFEDRNHRSPEVGFRVARDG